MKRYVLADLTASEAKDIIDKLKIYLFKHKAKKTGKTYEIEIFPISGNSVVLLNRILDIK